VPPEPSGRRPHSDFGVTERLRPRVSGQVYMPHDVVGETQALRPDVIMREMETSNA
jgi:hypothetical protein